MNLDIFFWRDKYTHKEEKNDSNTKVPQISLKIHDDF